MAFISTRADYAILLLRALAKREGFSSLRIIAKEQHLPYRYMSRLAGDLKKGGYLVSREGVQGGYTLAKKPATIKIINVIELLEGPLTPVRCTEAGKECSRAEDCPMKPHWTTLHRKLHAVLNETTLASVL